MLSASQLESLLKPSLRLRFLAPVASFLTPIPSPQCELPSESIQLRFGDTLSSLLHRRQRLGEYGQPFCSLPPLLICRGQQGQLVRPPQLCPARLPGGQALAYLPHPLFVRSRLTSRARLRGQRPAPQDRTP